MTTERRAAALTQDPLMAVLGPAMKVGAASGSVGFLFGGAAGILKGTTPFLFASASGLQTFALGTTFWATRTTVLNAWTPPGCVPTATDLTKASTLSGCITGGLVGAVLRGRSNALSGAIMFSIFGLLGQATYNAISMKPETTDQQSTPSFWKRMSDRAWSPVKIMSDEEYAELLKEKMVRLDVEIALLDDRIAALRKEQQVSETMMVPPPAQEKSP